ncbi:MAG: FAD-dependent oxidoreductase, partial [Burkholderiales bacterium]|nr:FAD-dependent oxidoreductase [Burkholderiales bacterium]
MARRGIEVEVIDRQPLVGQGSSSNRAAIVRPFPTLDMGSRNRFGWAAFLHAVRLYREVGRCMPCGWYETGVLQLARDAVHHERLERAVEILGYPPEVVRCVDAREASDLTGVEISEEGVWFAGGGWIDGLSLCAALINSVSRFVHFRGQIEVRAVGYKNGIVDIAGSNGQTVASGELAILANGFGAQALIPGTAPWLSAVRGQ